MNSETISKSALCLGHPGHEIKVLAWAAEHKPRVTIFTDGSGPNRPSRLESTRKILEAVGCEPALMFGNLADREIYGMMREGAEPFVQIAQQLEGEWTAGEVDTVAGDALEGFNTTHDVCRMVINAVVEKLRRKHLRVKNYAFPLEGLGMEVESEGELVVEMDQSLFEWKRDIVKSAYPEMAGEVDKAIAKYGEGPFQREVLHPAVEGRLGMVWEGNAPPFYETYGRRQIEKGHYHDLITYSEHLLPIAEGLWNWAEEGS
ncbi:hypothetical protein FEM03_09075 [Phragmitibacter flavus]|uniref:Uncharacterized protein n=1 Tax=Phragmitibacter flavus TaxID=2576071 RepID=A0A5R8KFH4_9BACT|nr:hypothetical protein [Phragmitibacter flavus]TLD71054.1 hypothetical protein FEM03_09075 [Phragmitibacter flavus]